MLEASHKRREQDGACNRTAAARLITQRLDHLLLEERDNILASVCTRFSLQEVHPQSAALLDVPGSN